jgi:hypothetical protein
VGLAVLAAMCQSRTGDGIQGGRTVNMSLTQLVTNTRSQSVHFPCIEPADSADSRQPRCCPLLWHLKRLSTPVANKVRQ